MTAAASGAAESFSPLVEAILAPAREAIAQDCSLAVLRRNVLPALRDSGLVMLRGIPTDVLVQFLAAAASHATPEREDHMKVRGDIHMMGRGKK